jgi:hypothetical protein
VAAVRIYACYKAAPRGAIVNPAQTTSRRGEAAAFGQPTPSVGQRGALAPLRPGLFDQAGDGRFWQVFIKAAASIG